MWTKAWWGQVLERAVKTAAQAALAFFVVGQTDLLAVDWRVLLSGVGVAVIASVLTSIVSTPVGPKGTPSLVRDGESDG